MMVALEIPLRYNKEDVENLRHIAHKLGILDPEPL
jgi:hypothetical protein